MPQLALSYPKLSGISWGPEGLNLCWEGVLRSLEIVSKIKGSKDTAFFKYFQSNEEPQALTQALCSQRLRSHSLHFRSPFMHSTHHLGCPFMPQSWVRVCTHTPLPRQCQNPGRSQEPAGIHSPDRCWWKCLWAKCGLIRIRKEQSCHPPGAGVSPLSSLCWARHPLSLSSEPVRWHPWKLTALARPSLLCMLATCWSIVPRGLPNGTSCYESGEGGELNGSSTEKPDGRVHSYRVGGRDISRGFGEGDASGSRRPGEKPGGRHTGNEWSPGREFRMKERERAFSNEFKEGCRHGEGGCEAWGRHPRVTEATASFAEVCRWRPCPRL